MEHQGISRRRSVVKAMFASIVAAGAGLFGATQVRAAGRTTSSEIKRLPDVTGSQQQEPPLFSGSVIHNGLVYIAGKGYHEEGDITTHTNQVLDQLEEELTRAGSSMDRVLKVNVYLHDLNDYSAMNEAYRGRFGNNPPVRTTVACSGGIPGDSLVEIDCIAAANDA